MGGVIGRSRLGAERPPWTRAHAVEAHEPGHPIFRATPAAGTQLSRHARAAVNAGVTMVMDGLHFLEELLVGSGTRTRGSGERAMISRARDAQGVAEFRDVEIAP